MIVEPVGNACCVSQHCVCCAEAFLKAKLALSLSISSIKFTYFVSYSFPDSLAEQSNKLIGL
jgi:hypothetical protein